MRQISNQSELAYLQGQKDSGQNTDTTVGSQTNSKDLCCHWLGLRGRVCVVTGAASGIGAAIASELAAAGAHVALLDRNVTGAERQVQALRKQGYRAIAVGCDIANESEIRSAAVSIRKQLGPVQALVNNAGLLLAGSLDAVSLDDWNRALSVNLTGYLLCSREFAMDMKANGRGSIVHIASVSALHPQTQSGSYSSSKAGVLLLSRQMAAEWGPSGIRSNVICPGMIRTPLSANFYKEPGFEARRAAMTTSRRVGEPIDIANPVLFLLSDRSSYLNGSEILVDGGLNCMLMDMVPRPGFNQAPANEIEK